LNLSHGVKNILQAVQGSREVVEKSLDVGDIERAKRGFKILQLNLDKINKLVLDMLKYSKEDSPEFANCDFNGIVVSAAGIFKGEAHESGKKIEIEVDEELPEVLCDSDKIFDVVLNLVMNAVYAVKAGEGVVEVRTKYIKENQQVKLEVRDNGAGIEDVESIFEPFHTTKAKLGTGLGLAIVRKIVGQHDGSINAQSGTDVGSSGSVFTVILPVKR